MSKYIPLSEFKENKDPLVCRVCGNAKGEKCCMAAHAYEDAKSPHNPNPTIGISCNCPKCIFTV